MPTERSISPSLSYGLPLPPPRPLLRSRRVCILRRYIIPTPVIHHFIADYERNGAYTGFPTLGVEWQKLENPHLRKSLGMKDGAKGVLLCQIEPTAPAHAALQKEVSE
jgi:hypothetical protein